ncbi:UPF0001 protein [Oscillospiraceae bacterium]|nr:UPF0001 protein [Oscillospiraceae bacterium]
MDELALLTQRVAAVRERMAAACAAAHRPESSVLLCAASKTQTPATVALAAGLPIDLFGENRVQELVEKRAARAYGQVLLHFIGHLQTNKVKQVVGAAGLIQSVGSGHLLLAVAKEAQKQGLVQPVFLEVNIGGEESKSGVAPAELPRLAELAESLPGVTVQGLMCIPPKAGTPAAQRRYFAAMRDLFDRLAAQRFSTVHMRQLSMGMSGDFEAAIAEGATIVRVGTALFGPRQ